MTLAASDEPTRRRILELVASLGPVTAAELATELDYTTAGVRRHLTALEEAGVIQVHHYPAVGEGPKRGRPARAYVAAPSQSGLPTNYRDLALGALRYLAEAGHAAGHDEAIEAFAAAQFADVAEKVAPLLTAEDQAGRAQQLAEVLTADGFAATVRPVTATLVPIAQLSQGNCPMRQAATEFPALCEAERQAFSTLLGTHVQRLATIAQGAHACVTNIPLSTKTPGN